MEERYEDDIWQPQWPQGHKPSFTYYKPTFEKHVGKSGKTWLVPAVTRIPNRGDHLYVTSSADPNETGTGFGGRTLFMPMMDGTEFELKGGWHSRSVDLLKDTDIDTSKQHLTFGGVSLHRTGDMWLYGLLYADLVPKIGYFDRIQKIAKDIATERGETVYYGVLSLGGSISGQMKGGDS